MIVYRLAKKEYINDLSGEGARLYGGRWNLPGTRCLCVSESAALSVLEFVVHYNKEVMPADLVMGKIGIPDSIFFETLKTKDLPKNWDKPGLTLQTQRFGSAFFSEGSKLGFRIPSTVSPYAFNLVINPLHPDFENIKFVGSEPFSLDVRIKE